MADEWEILQEAPETLPAGLGRYRRADFARLPERRYCELIRGRIYAVRPPSVLHGVAAYQVWRVLHAIAGERGGRAYYAPVDVAVEDHSLVRPDAFYLAAARAERFAAGGGEVPDLVVEVLSRESARVDRREKLVLYAGAGVAEVWLLEPEERRFEVLVLNRGHYRVASSRDEPYRSVALPGVTIDRSALWRQIAEAG